MPVRITKTRKGYRVSTPSGVHAKGTSLKKAKRQKRLLDALEHGWKPKRSRHHSAEDGKFIDDRRSL